MTYQSHVFTRKPLYIALALATLAMGNAPTAAFATQPAAAAATPAATPAAQPQQAADGAQSSSTDEKKTGKDKNGDNRNPTTLQTVVVTSFRQSVDQNMQDKRDSNSIVEVINAQNIAQFPAKNIADALAHVPGVVISR